MGTEILRPNADATYSEWTPRIVGDHYAMVDEVIADDSTTDLRTNTADERDSWTFPNTTASGTINKLTVYHKSKSRDTLASNKLALFYRESGANYDGDFYEYALHDTWESLSSVYATNPATTNAWTIAEINAMEWGILMDSAPDNFGYFTQVYVEVDYYIDYAESASVIIGIVASGIKSLGRTRTAAVIIGIVSSASRAVILTRTASVIVGVIAKAAIRTRILRQIVDFTNRKVMNVFTNLREWINHTGIRS